jgi:hypothetical protein
MTTSTSKSDVCGRFLARVLPGIGLAAGYIGLALTAASCVEPEAPVPEPRSAQTDGVTSAAVFPDRMWANSSWFASFVAVGPAVVGYRQVAFAYTNSSGSHSITTPIDSGGGSLVAAGSPFNGDVIRATWSGPQLDDVRCDFVFRYNGGAVFSFAEMGCVPQTVPPLPVGQVFPAQMWSNAAWISCLGPAVFGGYDQVNFDYTSFGVHQNYSLPVSSNGEFSHNFTSGQSPANFDAIHVTWSGPGLRSLECTFSFFYQGGAVYTFDERGCVPTPVSP